ncbi:extracellular solute-binding protein [Lachnospiraceae bacterium 38-14]|uniref:ABC transporter substrate-binding protein n=1 Tax=Roseburia sp. 1XD42-69 TaxID=2320088 RepID=UPI000EA102F2|nr:extracellular solute-binding protein [Roseburia sp. 1XD42-69]RKJ64056.1 extracellular solute-binding protein [Roseburia sp. 1XD42-69]
MSKRKIARRWTAMVFMAVGITGLAGCAGSETEGKVEVELVSYKPEAVEAFEKIQDRFNETHQDIHLTIDSPNEAMTILKTRFIREDYPQIVGIGGDINYSNFLDADLFLDISDLEEVTSVKQSYQDMSKELEFVPREGVYCLPYAANAAGILYNKDLFEKQGWEVPETWNDFVSLCKEIEAEGMLPLYFGYKDTWTCLAPWNALAVGLSDSDTCNEVNLGNTTFSEEYREVADKMRELLSFGEPNPYAYSYNDACTAFARGESAMYPIGSYAIPQILSVNPDLNIGSFPFPANENEADNVLNSGIDLQFCVMKDCENKEAVYEVLRFLYEDETIQVYLDNQGGIACKEGDFDIPGELLDMKNYIEGDRMADFQDHHYPSEMSVDAMIQTFLLNESDNAADIFLAQFDSDWKRYNRDLIRKVQQYQKEREDGK